jgi:hypothetical protein
VVDSIVNRDYRPSTESTLPRNLFIIVAVLGLVSYGAGFGPVGAETLGWYVRFAALAGLLAVFGLLSKTEPPAVATAAFAALGFLDALFSVVTTSDPGWALTLIVVLNALQTAAAVAAVLMSPKPASDSTAAAGYEAYVDYYNQAVRNYYGQAAQPSMPEQSKRGGYAAASASAQATPQAQRTQRPSQYADYGDLDYTGARARTHAPEQTGGTGAAGEAGMPSVGRTQRSSDHAQRGEGESSWPASP